jgi:thiol-disulfide isomerase/thioredoxin
MPRYSWILDVLGRRGGPKHPRSLGVGRVASAVLVALTMVACTPAAGSAPGAFIAVADRVDAPAVRGDLLGGGSFDLADHEGDVVVVNFWASWCGPCWAEADDLEKVYQATRAKGVTFIGINTRDEKDAALGFVRDRAITYPSLVDRPGKVALGFDVPPSVIPATILIDRRGKVAMLIPKAVLGDELEPFVNQLAAESP